MSNAENRPAGDARTAPVAVWSVLEKLRGQDLADWRTAPLPGRPSADERNLGEQFAIGWFPVMLSADLAVGEVKPLRAFAHDYAVWRGEDGKVRIIDAYCKHLGAHMGHGGKVHGNLLECPFHAWRYDGEDGTVKEIPYSKSIPPQVKRKCTGTYHVDEANRWIYVWYHPTNEEPGWQVERFAESSDPAWTDYDICEWRVYGSLQNMAENGVDFAHFKYIHGTAEYPEAELIWDGVRRTSIVKARMGTPMGEVDGRITATQFGSGQSSVRFTGISETLLVASTLPIERDEIHVRFCFTQPREQRDGPMGGLAKAIVRDICKQLDQDKVIWDRQRFEPNAIICEGDGPIAQFRKWYQQFYVGGDDKPTLKLAS